MLARDDCALISLTYNHAGPAVAGVLKPVKYSLNTSRNIVELTLLNIWRHMEAVYDWEPAMFEALYYRYVTTWLQFNYFSIQYKNL